MYHIITLAQNGVLYCNVSLYKVKKKVKLIDDKTTGRERTTNKDTDKHKAASMTF